LETWKLLSIKHGHGPWEAATERSALRDVISFEIEDEGGEFRGLTPLIEIHDQSQKKKCEPLRGVKDLEIKAKNKLKIQEYSKPES
jgi:hypothetical protein